VTLSLGAGVGVGLGSMLPSELLMQLLPFHVVVNSHGKVLQVRRPKKQPRVRGLPPASLLVGSALPGRAPGGVAALLAIQYFLLHYSYYLSCRRGLFCSVHSTGGMLQDAM
jgi:hypothetical protein